jgi:hypothetical protein
MNENIDLFEQLVRFLAIKPLKFEAYDFEEAQTIIKKEKQGAVSFIGEHGYFEKTLDVMVGQAATSEAHHGTIYINIQGEGCTAKIKKRLMELSMHVDSIIIFGDPEKWPAGLTNVKFTQNFDILKDNHQRFFIYHSPAYNIALISRHEKHNGAEKTEAIVSNDQQAIDMLGVTIGTKVYPLI